MVTKLPAQRCYLCEVGSRHLFHDSDGTLNRADLHHYQSGGCLAPPTHETKHREEE